MGGVDEGGIIVWSVWLGGGLLAWPRCVLCCSRWAGTLCLLSMV